MLNHVASSTGDGSTKTKDPRVEGVQFSLFGVQPDRRKTENRNPKTGFTLIELLIVICIVAMLIGTVLPVLAMARKLSDRDICAANVRAIVQAMLKYANANQGFFPNASSNPFPNTSPNYRYANPPMYNGATGPTLGTVQAAVKVCYDNSKGDPTGTYLSPGLGLWILVLQDYAKEKTFICPSDPLALGPSAKTYIYQDKKYYNSTFGDVPGTTVHLGSYPDGAMVSAGAYNYLGQGESYSIACPWPWENGTFGAVGTWFTTKGATAKVPLISDMAPLDSPAGEDTTGTYQRITTTLPTSNTYGPYIYNSGNHAGAGQNVGFGDGHVTWATSPYVGQNGDNIFTYSTSYDVAAGATDIDQVGLTGTGQYHMYTYNGSPNTPPKILTLTAPFDTCMAPVRSINPKYAAKAGFNKNSAW